MPMASKRPPNAPLGPCYKCGGDHLIKDCPYPRQPRPCNVSSVVPALTRYCLDCGIKHVVPDCPLNPDKKAKATLNIVETIPSTSEQENEEVAPVQEITRAQRKLNPETQQSEEDESERSSRNSWKARRQRRMAAKKNRAEKLNSDNKVEKNGKELNGGSVLADQALEPLKTMLDAYEVRLKPKETLEERFRAYLDPT